MGILILFQMLAGRLSAFEHLISCWLWFCQIIFIMLRYVPSIHTLVRNFFFFTINGCWILSNVFSAYIKMIMELLFFIDVMYHIDWFTYIKASWWFWVESNLIMVYNLFYVLLDFCIYHQRYWPVIFFFFFGSVFV